MKKLINSIVHIISYTILIIVFIVLAFIAFLKINPINITSKINYLKEKSIISSDFDIKSLTLAFDTTFVLIADDIQVNIPNKLKANIKSASIELVKTELVKGKLSFKNLFINNSDITIFLNENKNTESIAQINSELNISSNSYTLLPDNDIYKSLNQISYFNLISNLKTLEISNSNLNIIAKNGNHLLKDISISFDKIHDEEISLKVFGSYSFNDKFSSIIKANMIIPKNDDSIKITVESNNINLKHISNLLPESNYSAEGIADLKINTTLNRHNQISDITVSVIAKNGSFAVNDLYNEKLGFKHLDATILYSPKENSFILKDTHLIDTNNNRIKSNGDFSITKNNDLMLNIYVDIAKIKLKPAFSYIPDLGFKTWLNDHIFKGDITNLKFAYTGKLGTLPNGYGDNSKFDISLNFDNLELDYLDNIPTVRDIKGKFNMSGDTITIDIDSAMHSEQVIKRANLTLKPLINNDKFPVLKLNALTEGSVEDALNVLNKKLDLNQDELFKHYKGIQEAETNIELFLEDIKFLDKSVPNLENIKPLKVDVLVDIQKLDGVEPVFNQKFKATNSTVRITEDKLYINASGLSNDNNFKVSIEEELLNFGNKSIINVDAKLDSFILKPYLQIPSLNLSGIVDAKIKLNNNDGLWSYDLESELSESLINFPLLNYNKPFTKPGKLKSEGSFDINKSILDIKSFNAKLNQLKASGYAHIDLNTFTNSSININNLKVNDTTDLNKLSYKNRSLVIKGDMLDLRPLELFEPNSKSMIKNATSKNKEDTKPSAKALEQINIKLNKAYLTDDKSIEDLYILLDLSKAYSGVIKGQSDIDDQDFYIRFNPVTKDHVKVESLIPNFGNVLKRTEVYTNFNNGFGILFGDLYFKDDQISKADLTVNIKKFQLLEAPLLAQALASISFEQLLSKKNGILFDNLYANLSFNDSILSLTNIKIHGPSLGILSKGFYDLKTKTLDLDGTLVPVVKLNSALSVIPVVGYLLTGSQGAISGADFKIYGRSDKPKVKVQPLSILTPGIVKDLFESLENFINPQTESKAIKKARKRLK